MTQIAGFSHDETLQFPTRVGEAVEVYRDPYTVIRRQEAEFDGFRKEYYMWDRGVRAGVLPVDGKRILLTHQYRFLANRITTEVAGGKVEDGEEPVDAAMRECREETGVICRSCDLLLHYHPGLDTYHNPTSIFYSTDLEKPLPETNERFLWMDLEDAVRAVFDGRINDSLSIIAILALSQKLRPNPIS